VRSDALRDDEDGDCGGGRGGAPRVCGADQGREGAVGQTRRRRKRRFTRARLQLACRPMRALVIVALPPLAFQPSPATHPGALAALPDAGLRPLLHSIEHAAPSLDLEVYLLSHPLIIAALRDARARGVRTRVLLEPHPFGGGDNAAV